MQTRKLLFILPVLIGSLAATAPALLQAADTQSDQSAANAPGDGSQTHERRHHDPAAHAQKRLERLKSELRITPEQEPKWSAFSDTVRKEMEQFNTARRGVQQPVKAPERIDRQVALMKERVAAFENIAQAAKDLYASLTPEQQQIADERLLRFHQRQHAG